MGGRGGYVHEERGVLVFGRAADELHCRSADVVCEVVGGVVVFVLLGLALVRHDVVVVDTVCV